MSGLGQALVTFTPSTVIRSGDVNTNFSNLNDASSFTGIVNLLSHSLSRLSYFTGTGTGAGQVVNHNLGATPTIVLVMYSGAFGGPPSTPIYYYGVTSTQVTIRADSGFAWVALALAF